MSTSNPQLATNITELASCDQSLETTFMVLNIIIAVVILIGNVLVFIPIAMSPRLRQQPMNMLIASMSVTDIIMATCVAPGYSIFCVDCMDYSLSKYCWFMEGPKDIALGSSCYNLLAISYDRALAVYRPLRYPDVMTRRKAYFIIAMVWCLSLLIALIRNFWVHTTTEAELRALNVLYNTILLVVVVLIPCLIISVVNIKILLTIRKQANQVFPLGDPQGPAETSQEAQDEIARKRKGMLACALIVIVFVVSWIPRIAFNITFMITKDVGQISALLHKLSIFFFIVQSSVNPFIYAFYRADLRRAAFELLTCKKFY